MSPFLVTSAQAESLPAVGTLELVPRNCLLEDYTKKTVPEFKIGSDFIHSGRFAMDYRRPAAQGFDHRHAEAFVNGRKEKRSRAFIEAPELRV